MVTISYFFYVRNKLSQLVLINWGSGVTCYYIITLLQCTSIVFFLLFNLDQILFQSFFLTMYPGK